MSVLIFCDDDFSKLRFSVQETDTTNTFIALVTYQQKRTDVACKETKHYT
jgi:hypothetical protein